MPIFLARVQIHPDHRSEDDYKILHDTMFENGFLRTVKSGGVEYKLPHATYLIESAFSEKKLVDLIKSATVKVSLPEAQIIVFKVDDNFEISGLTPVKKPVAPKIEGKVVVRNIGGSSSLMRIKTLPKR